MKNIILFISFFFSLVSSAQDIGFLSKRGEAMPDFTVRLLNDSILDTRELRGKVVLLDFWGAKCGGCLLELKRFSKEIVEVYGKRKDFFLLPVEVQKHTKAEVEACATRMGFDFTLALEDKQDIAGLYFNRHFGLPRTLIIDRKGKIVYQSFGYTEEEFSKMLTVLEETINKQN